MCLPWNHKWETTDSYTQNIYREYSDGSDLPLYIYKVITQRCTHCGKEIVRKYRA